MKKIEDRQFFSVVCYAIALFVGTVGSLALSAYFTESNNTYIFLNFTIPQVCYVASVVILGKLQGYGGKDFLQKKNVKASGYLLALLIGLGTFAVALMPNQGIQILLQKIGTSATVTVPTFDTPVDYVLGVLTICILPALGEELLFRKVFCDGLRGAKEYKIVLLGGLFFSLSHLNLAQTVHQFVLGCILCFLYIRTENITLTMVVHCINNVLALFIEEMTGADFWRSWIVLGIAFVIGFVLLAVSLLLLRKFFPKKEETGTKIKKPTVILLGILGVLWGITVVAGLL